MFIATCCNTNETVPVGCAPSLTGRVVLVGRVIWSFCWSHPLVQCEVHECDTEAVGIALLFRVARPSDNGDEILLAHVVDVCFREEFPDGCEFWRLLLHSTANMHLCSCTRRNDGSTLIDTERCLRKKLLDWRTTSSVTEKTTRHVKLQQTESHPECRRM